MQSGGPTYKVLLGRRDSASFATQQDVLSGLPPPTAAVPALLAMLSKINLDATDLVALSGGHTIGLGHCTSFEDRLFPRPDPTLNATFASQLRRTCPASHGEEEERLEEDCGCVVAVFGVCKAETRSRLAGSYRHGLVTRPPRACG